MDDPSFCLALSMSPCVPSSYYTFPFHVFPFLFLPLLRSALAATHSSLDGRSVSLSVRARPLLVKYSCSKSNMAIRSNCQAATQPIFRVAVNRSQ